jgi:ABC-type microcin C transport system duplicated ATPase subunit YejF
MPVRERGDCPPLSVQYGFSLFQRLPGLVVRRCILIHYGSHFPLFRTTGLRPRRAPRSRRISLETGERVGLIGRNGTGKSSLLKIIPADSSWTTACW